MSSYDYFRNSLERMAKSHLKNLMLTLLLVEFKIKKLQIFCCVEDVFRVKFSNTEVLNDYFKL